VGIKLGPAGVHRLGLDVGGWFGRDRLSSRDTGAFERRVSLGLPMAGLSWLVGFL
jgi:hypothetical protein